MINHTWGDSSVFMCLSCILESYISHTSIKYTNFLQNHCFHCSLVFTLTMECIVMRTCKQVTVGNVQALGANQIAAFSPKPHG